MLLFKKIPICIVFIFFTSILAKCKKSSWYDAKSTRALAVPTKLSDIQAIMDNAEKFSQSSPALGEASADDYFLDPITFDNMVAMEKSIYTWSHSVPYERISEWNSSNTRGAFPKIYSCNLSLDELDKIEIKTSAELESKKYIKGQALFHRARTLYEIAQVYAPPYLSYSNPSGLGVPMPLSSDVTKKIERENLQNSYNRILSDLLESIGLLPKNELPISNLAKTRPTRVAVWGLLARIYLSIEDYTKAELYADSCLEEYDTLIDYSSIPNGRRPFALMNSEVIWHSTMSNQFLCLSTANATVDSNLYNSYASDDLRKTYYFNYNSATRWAKFKGQYSGSATYFTGIATDEIYLIKAECQARLGDFHGSMNTLNSILKKRWKKINGTSTLIDFVASSQDEALDIVLSERRKELLFRGLRWSDLRRLNNDPKHRKVIVRITSIGESTLDPNSFKYTLPIPDDVIRISGMNQNIGWQ